MGAGLQTGPETPRGGTAKEAHLQQEDLGQSHENQGGLGVLGEELVSEGWDW